MRLRVLKILALASLFPACNQTPEPPIEIHDISIYAPLPGTGMSVAYLRLRNNTAQTMTVNGVSSPEFRRVEIHESTLVDGIARMRKLDELTIPPRSALLLEENGKHLMLMEPVDSLELDQPISLRIQHDTAGEIVIRSALQSRVQLDIGENEPR